MRLHHSDTAPAYWRHEAAARVSYVVDAEVYFRALFEAFEKAERSILMLGWGVSAHTSLLIDESGSPFPRQLGPLLYDLVERRPELEVRILCWNFPFVHAPSREPTPDVHAGWRPHPRIHLILDDVHPIGASHHQKVVVIDETLAFSGGLDVCNRRWDTTAHLAKDPRRTDDQGFEYQPFHDIQMAVDDKAASALGDLFRERWRRCTGETLEVRLGSAGFWPASLPVDAENATVDISLTYPHFGGFPEQRENEALTVQSIAKAKRLIYIENQYLTSRMAVAALEESLRKDEGPEIVMLLQSQASHFIELATMMIPENRMLKRLKRADLHGRLSIYFPWIEGIGEGRITVHSKLTIIDDDFVRIGSTNLNNRSMGLDTECDLSIEAKGRTDLRKSIRRLRHRLMAEHMGLNVDDVERLEDGHRPLSQFIRDHTRPGRAYLPLKRHTPYGLRWLAYETRLSDPEASTKREQLLSDFLARDELPKEKSSLVGFAKFAALVLLIAALWTFAPLASWREQILHMHFGPFLIFAAFALSGLLLLPTVQLTWVALTLLGWQQGFFYTWAGLVVVAFVQRFLGSRMPMKQVRKLVYHRLEGLGQRLTRVKGVPSALLRMLPIAPVTVLNLVIGAEHAPWRNFVLLAVFGSLPFLLFVTGIEILLTMLSRFAGLWAPAAFLVTVLIVLGVWMLLSPRAKQATRRKRVR